jgi:imidazolonepropionase-like amidohydrolase
MCPKCLSHVILCAVLAMAMPESCAQQPAATPSNVPPLPADIPVDATRSSVLFMGTLAGQQATWKTSDGKLHAFFQFNDRGRGPKTSTVFTLSSNGNPVSEVIKGNDYFKSDVDEGFSLDGETAHWKNRAEQGVRKVADNVFYVSMNGPPEEQLLLVRAALANGGKIALLPEGEARVQEVLGLDVEAAGKRKQVKLYSLMGLDFLPQYVWLDEAHEYFAAGDRWFMPIREGWEGTQEALLSAQNGVTAARAAQLAKKLAYHYAEGIVFRHANLFDAESGKIVPNQTVVIVWNRIASVAPGKMEGLPAGTLAKLAIDATGKTLIPGLWDMHAHVSDGDGLLNLAAGVTTVRDLGNTIDELIARRKRIEEGTEVGTRIILAGIIDGPGPYQGPTKVLATTEAEARDAVDKYARLGYEQIKIYSSVKPELVPVIIDEAHKAGLRVSGHIPAYLTASVCVKLGYDEIQHVNFLVLNFFPEVKETQTSLRLTEPAKLGADLDLHSRDVQGFIQLLKDHRTIVDPTMSIFESQYTARPGEISPGFATVFKRIPVQVRRSLLNGGLQVPEGMDARYRESFAKMVALVGLLYKAGVPIEAGTDSLAGFALQRELELDAQAGIPPAGVLKLATLGAARIMKRDSELGSIAPGKLADVVLVDGNPVANISDVRKTVVVVKNGVVYKPSELDAELGIQP